MENLSMRKVTRLPAYDYSTAGAYFLTLCTENRRCILSRIVETGSDGKTVGTGVLDGPQEGTAQIELLPYGEIADKYIRQLHDFYDYLSVDDYVIMPNHIHLIVSLTQDGPSRTPVPTIQNSAVSRFVSTFKRFCNKEYGKNIWQYRSYDHVIRNQKDYAAHLQYIHENPLAWHLDKLYANE